MNCTLCDTFLENKADKKYFVCYVCGGFVKDKKYYLSTEKEKERYKEHNNDVNDIRYQKFTSPITNEIFKNYSKEHIGLDYGCGTAPVISKQLKDKGYRVKLYDPYFLPDESYLNNKYDYIFSCEVFEHFLHPKQEIEKLLHLLKQEGRLYIMTHLFHPKIDFNNWYYRNDPTHVFIYTFKTIEYIAAIHTLNIDKLTERSTILRKLALTKP